MISGIRKIIIVLVLLVAWTFPSTCKATENQVGHGVHSQEEPHPISSGLETPSHAAEQAPAPQCTLVPAHEAECEPQPIEQDASPQYSSRSPHPSYPSHKSVHA